MSGVRIVQTKRNRWIGAALAAGLGLGVSSAAMAHIALGLDIGLPGPVYQPAPVYQSAPVYQPAPAYQPAYQQPAYQPAYQADPAEDEDDADEPDPGYQQGPGYGPQPVYDSGEQPYGPQPVYAPAQVYAPGPGVVAISPGWYGARYYDGHRYWERAAWQRGHPEHRNQPGRDDRHGERHAHGDDNHGHDHDH
jgi:hypothetical protein